MQPQSPWGGAPPARCYQRAGFVVGEIMAKAGSAMAQQRSASLQSQFRELRTLSRFRSMTVTDAQYQRPVFCDAGVGEGTANWGQGQHLTRAFLLFQIPVLRSCQCQQGTHTRVVFAKIEAWRVGAATYSGSWAMGQMPALC